MKNLIVLLFMIIMYNVVFVDKEVSRDIGSVNKIDCSFNKYVNKSKFCSNYDVNKLVK